MLNSLCIKFKAVFTFSLKRKYNIELLQLYRSPVKFHISIITSLKVGFYIIKQIIKHAPDVHVYIFVFNSEATFLFLAYTALQITLKWGL